MMDEERRKRDALLDRAIELINDSQLAIASLRDEVDRLKRSTISPEQIKQIQYVSDMTRLGRLIFALLIGAIALIASIKEIFNGKLW